MIQLYLYPPIWGLPSLSPFCSKVYYYLKWFNFEFEVITVNNPRKGPKGKFPIIKDGAEIIADSEFIIRTLNQKYRTHLSITAEEYPILRLVEEHLYFIILYSRWIDPIGKPIIDTAFKPFFPIGSAKLCLYLIRHQLKRQGYYQGIARHSREEVYQKGIDDLLAVETYLRQKSLKRTLIDVTLYPFLNTINNTPINNPLKTFISDSQTISDYLNHLNEIV